MKVNFDRIINRAGTNSAKWETIISETNSYIHERTERFFGGNASIPMWIADMDFAAPKEVVDALTARVKHGIYGYTELSASYSPAVVNWMKTRHKWDIQPEWIVTTPGIVPALAMLARTFIKSGEKVIIQPPVYYPFASVLNFNEIEIVENRLRYENSRYQIDFDDLESKARDPQTKMIILSNPHNPVGRVWTREELSRVAEICRANDVLVISDEIHADLAFQSFTPFGTIDANAIVCTATSKTFNLAGLSTSNIIISQKDLREKFSTYMLKNALSGSTFFGLLATETAYAHGAYWLDQLLAYLSDTLDFMESYFAKHIPQIRMIRPEGTYLVWLDCRALGMDATTLHRFFSDRARVYLEQGAIFGTGGEGFLRMNIATPRKAVKEALNRMREAVESLPKK